jgi:hypothetical protein
LKFQLPHVGTSAPHARVDTSQAHWLLLQVFFVPWWALQSMQLGPQRSASLLLKQPEPQAWVPVLH